MYGIQTDTGEIVPALQFENDVKMYGIQTNDVLVVKEACLRMM